MQKRIVGSSGSEYMTVEYTGDLLLIKNLGPQKVTVSLDARVIEQLAPFLNEVNFWRKVESGRE